MLSTAFISDVNKLGSTTAAVAAAVDDDNNSKKLLVKPLPSFSSSCRHVPQVEMSSTALISDYSKLGPPPPPAVDDNFSNRNRKLVTPPPPPRDEFSWTSLISEHTKRGHPQQALQTYHAMRAAGVAPSCYTFVAALKACGTLQDPARTRAVHRDLAAHLGAEADVYVATALAGAYSKCGMTEDARAALARTPPSRRDVVCWTAIVLGHAQAGDGRAGLQVFEDMRRAGVVPDARAFVAVLKACGCCGAGEATSKSSSRAWVLEQVRAVHAQVVERGVQADGHVGTLLVDVYCKCGSLDDARKVLEGLPRRDVFVYTAMIMGYAQAGDGGAALELYARMRREGVVPDARALLAAVKACGGGGEEGGGGGEDGGNSTLPEQLEGVHRDAVALGHELDVYVGAMLVDVYAKCGALGVARDVFDRMPRRNVVAWTAMISGYARLGQGEAALRLYWRMRGEGAVAPNERTFVGALVACGSVAALDQGRQVHEHIILHQQQQTQEQSPTTMDAFLASSLIDMYAKCGSMVDAQRVFDAASTADTPSWNALIGGYARSGQPQRALELLEQMQAAGTPPAAVTILGVLTACSHAGEVDRGRAMFAALARGDLPGLAPGLEHYTCLVDMLARAGRVEEALGVATAAPFPPDAALWESVLGGCLKWRKLELGLRAFQHASSASASAALSPGAYVLMANMYARARMWGDARRVQADRLAAGAWKQPGRSSWTDAQGEVHTFGVGDTAHPDWRVIHARLRDLGCEMVRAGAAVVEDAEEESDAGGEPWEEDEEEPPAPAPPASVVGE